MHLIAKTFHGLEEVLAKEIDALGGKNICILKRAVSFDSNKELLYKSNLHLRTAIRILQPICKFKAQNEDELYKKAGEFNWQAFLKPDQTFAIDSVVFSDQFRHSKYAALKIKDAIADQFRKKTGKRPSVDTSNPNLRLNVHVSQTEFTISMDSSGESLHKRGYRRNQHQAPLNEVLASGMLMLAGWNKTIPLIDPMCGSGTILIEAAMLACNIPPGMIRKNYGFMKWNNYDPQLWERICDEATSGITSPKLNITGADISSSSVQIAKEATEISGVDKHIWLIKSDFKDFYPQTESGMLIMNPPYGERLMETDTASLYKMTGDQLKKHFHGFEAWILSHNNEALKHIGLHPCKKLTLFNGPLECKFQKFNLYK